VDFVVLKTLPEGGVTPNKLAERLGLTKPAITYTVDRLESHGLVRRQCNTSDRRRVMITLTKKGRRVLGRADTSIYDPSRRG
jgi:DNA-binding MarR family transcriptional regulator